MYNKKHGKCHLHCVPQLSVQDAEHLSHYSGKLCLSLQENTKNKKHGHDSQLGIKTLLKNVSKSKTGMKKATLPL